MPEGQVSDVRNTPELIVESATRLLRERGSRKTTIVDIADAAGVSRATVYAYFKDKRAIIEAIARTSSHHFYRDMVDAMDGETTLEAQMGAAAAFLVGTLRSEGHNSSLTEDERALLLTINAKSLFLDCIDFLTPYIARARVTGEIRDDVDVRSAAEWIARILFSLASTPSSTLDLDDPVAVQRFVSEHAVRGLANPATTRRGARAGAR